MSPLRNLPHRPSAAVALAFGTLLLAGCAERHSIEVGSIPDDYRSRHPIVVDEREVALEIRVTSSDVRLSVPDRDRVQAFGQRFRASRSAAIRVLLPDGSVNEHAAGLASRDVVAVLRKAGIPAERILVQPYRQGAGRPGALPIRISFATLVAETAPCGRWPDQLADTEQNRNYVNFGCASQQNLAAQIADPRDLLAPRAPGPVDAARRTDMLEDYRLGRDTASQKPITQSDYDW